MQGSSLAFGLLRQYLVSKGGKLEATVKSEGETTFKR